MKKIILISLIAAAFGSNVWARHGENDGGQRPDDGRLIVCSDKSTNAVILQFMSTQLQGQISTPDFDLSVKARGDDVGEMSILDHRSGDSIKAKRLEELLKVTLTTDESTTPIILETATQKGFAQLAINDPTSGDSATVTSQSRQGVSQMEIELKTDENPKLAISIVCKKSR